MDRLIHRFLIHLALRRTKPNILLDFEQTAQTCLSHERLSGMTTPRYFFRSGFSKGMFIQFMAGNYRIELPSYQLHFTFKFIKGQANRR